MPQESNIVFKQKTDVGNPVFEHGHALQPHAESETGIAFRIITDVLKDGGILGVFPEGTRSVSGEMLPFKSGGSYLASQSPCTILPMAITGTERLLHFFSKPIVVRIGEPFPFAALAGEKKRDTLDRMTKMQEEAIRELLLAPEKAF